MASIIVNGSTRIDVTGLNPQQIAQVKKISTTGGKYGGKGAALAKSLQAKNKTATTAAGTTPAGQTPVSQTPGAVPGEQLGINNDGTIDPNKAVGTVTGAAANDTNVTFETSNPTSQTDAFGNTQEIERDPITGKTKIKQGAGAGLSAANDAFTGLAKGLSGAMGGRMGAQNASYNYITRNYATNKAQETEAAKQELAERGIPIDPNKGSLWEKTLSGINNRYQELDDQANNQALLAGNQYYATDVNAVSQLGSTVAGQSPSFTAFQGGQSTIAPNLQAILQTIPGFNMTKYQTDKDFAAKMDALAVEKSKVAKMGSGGGGGGGNEDPFIIGGEAP